MFTFSSVCLEKKPVRCPYVLRSSLMPRVLLLLVVFLLPLAAHAQTPADSIQAFHGPNVAFTWPMPFDHVPQTFTKQGVRFTAPYGEVQAALYALDVNVWPSSSSSDGFNDTLLVRFFAPGPDGTPDELSMVGLDTRIPFDQVPSGTVALLDLTAALVILDPGDEVWATLELASVGTPDTLVLVSDVAEPFSQGRAAAFVEGTGWRLLQDTQFGAEYIFHVAAYFTPLAIVGIEVVPPAAFALQVWPHPADTDAHVAFTLPGPASVTITLYDAQGRAVYDAPLGRLASGPHRHMLPGHLAAGVYGLVLRAGDQQAMRMVVVR